MANKVQNPLISEPTNYTVEQPKPVEEYPARVSPYYDHAGITIYHGDCREILPLLPAESVNCVVTSPPYWGLRDYGIRPSVWGGRPDCEHQWGEVITENATNHTDKRRWQHTRNGRDEEQPKEKRVAWLRTPVPQGKYCQLCGAWAGCFGLEPTPDLYVEHAVEIFREVRRVLRADGTLWLDIGDCYATGAGLVGECPGGGDRGERWKYGYKGYRSPPQCGKHEYISTAMGPITQPNRMPLPGLKPKDLVGMPWRVAFALQACGWYLRSDIIWAKPNPMPESVTDRPTKSHEYIFLLANSDRYYYNQAAIFEDAIAGWNGSRNNPLQETRNKRSVWTVNTEPYPDAHYATFPQELIKPCILAGCPQGGVVLDPFLGSGTTALVAQNLHCRCIGIELNEEYIDRDCRNRLRQDVFDFQRKEEG